jgi:type IV pilus assembly protein PilX
VALLVVTATQSYNTEQRISTNDADRKLATTLAEAALREGENQIFDIEGKKTTFTAKCEKGLCSTPNVKSRLFAMPLFLSNGYSIPLVSIHRFLSHLRFQASTVGLPSSVKSPLDFTFGVEHKPFSHFAVKVVYGTEYPLDKKSGIANNPRYIIEYLGKTTEGRITYRVTAKAWGKNANSFYYSLAT